MRKFVIRHVYKDKTRTTFGEMRLKKWKKMKKKCVSRIGCDEDSFSQRALWVAFQSYIWFHFDQVDGPPSPLNNGYQVII